jgi:hypothetical protein
MHIRKFLGKKFTFYLKSPKNSQLVIGKESILGVYDKVYENSNVLGKMAMFQKKMLALLAYVHFLLYFCSKLELLCIQIRHILYIRSQL